MFSLARQSRCCTIGHVGVCHVLNVLDVRFAGGFVLVNRVAVDFHDSEGGVSPVGAIQYSVLNDIRSSSFG